LNPIIWTSAVELATRIEMYCRIFLAFSNRYIFLDSVQGSKKILDVHFKHWAEAHRVIWWPVSLTTSIFWKIDVVRGAVVIGFNIRWYQVQLLMCMYEKGIGEKDKNKVSVLKVSRWKKLSLGYNDIFFLVSSTL